MREEILYAKGINTNYLVHFGTKGQKKGVRRWQNYDGTNTEAGLARRRKFSKEDRKDLRWLNRHGSRITSKVEKAVQPYMNRYAKEVLNSSVRKLRTNGRVSKNYINAYNKELARVMNMAVAEIPGPSGRVVKFVANRGTVGVRAALADKNDDMSAYKSGVYGNGRIAYTKKKVMTG